MHEYTLEVTCKVAPEYLPLYEKKLLLEFSEKEGIWCSPTVTCTCSFDESCDCYYSSKYLELSKKYRDIVNLWVGLYLSNGHIHYAMKGDELTLTIVRSWSEIGNVEEEMEECIHEILVPTTTEILSCVITEEDDDSCMPTRRKQYTDMQLRRQFFRLSGQIKSLHHVWIDGEIAETRVVYKRSVQAKHQLDLERAYCL